ncbi:MAG: o-succinylbenzoate synthase [Brumimicrobium sp.]
MSLKATFEKRIFTFKKPSGTSRGVLTEKKAWFITIWNKENPSVHGIGECSIIPKLSPDYESEEQYELKVKEVAEKISVFAENLDALKAFPSIYFGLEMALMDLNNGGKRMYFDTSFYRGKTSLPINGLIWMGAPDFMEEQIQEKLKAGFSCIKMKIGAIDFEEELRLIKMIRKNHSADKITLRVDANGAFSPSDALEKLKELAKYDIHSIEQPIKQGQWKAMRSLCDVTPLPIALDEELIGIHSLEDKREMLEAIHPQYIILKPSLVGGFKGCVEWIELAGSMNIPWWITSALESNIGLDAIAQFTSIFPVKLPQGLGTGSLYTNNISSDLVVENGEIRKETSC